MTKQEALQLMQEMEDFLAREPGPGWNKEADAFFRERCYSLKVAVPFNVDCSNVVNWAGIYYSAKKWERYGENKVRGFLLQALAKVRTRTEGYYDTGEEKTLPRAGGLRRRQRVVKSKRPV